jgi:High-affinity nickel-transport protein
MLSLLSTLFLGFCLGMRHAADPDHVVAVTTIVSRGRSLRQAGWVGALWGAGHSLTILLVGSAIILFNWVVSPRVALSMELAVGLMLIVLGMLNLTGALQAIKAVVGRAPATPRAGVSEPTDPAVDRLQVIRPIAVGIVHGLAGSAAVALLVLTTIQDPRWAVAYLLVFGAGTVAGMMLITVAIAAPFTYGARQLAVPHRSLQAATGLVSVTFGLFIAYQIGIVDGLFAEAFR